MRVTVNEPALLTDLMSSFGRGRCPARRVDERTIDVIHREATDAREARVEVSFFLRAWGLKHPGVDAVLVA